MQIDFESSLFPSLNEAIANLQKIQDVPQEHHLVWRRESNSIRRGEEELRPNWTVVLIEHSKLLASSTDAIRSFLADSFPDHLGLVGTNLGGQFRLDADHVCRWLVGEVLERAALAKNHALVLRGVRADLSAFLVGSTVSVRCLAPLANFACDDAGLDLSLNKYRINRLGDDDFNRLYGGSFRSMASARPWIRPMMDEYAIEFLVEDKKLLGDDQMSTDDRLNEIYSDLDKIILSLRTFQSGAVGFSWVLFVPTRFVPFGLPAYGRLHEYVPIGVYRIMPENIQSLRGHLECFDQAIHPVLETACRRLGFASIRTNPADRLVDAVVGLEAILLHDQGDPQYRGELSYRCALNYACLDQSLALREKRFRIARDLYAVRSIVVHGGSQSSKEHKLGDERLDLKTVADRAVEILREVVHRFISNAQHPEFASGRFWLDNLFSLPSTANSNGGG